MTAGRASNILVIKLGALGDVALAMPHIARIQTAFPQDRVTLLTAPEYAPLAAVLPGLEVAGFSRKGFLAMTRLLRFWRRQPGIENRTVTVCAPECGILETVTIKGKKIDKSKINENAEIIPSGVAQVAHLQQRGYMYVKP